MAVQKSKVSRRRRGNRRSHDALESNANSMQKCKLTAKIYRSHHMTEDGLYNGKETKLSQRRAAAAENRE